MTVLRRAALLAVPFGLFLATQASEGKAAPPTKEECVETHSRAQDYRDKGQLADAKRLFLLCAQQSCPALIQSDCAKFGEELGRSVPSVSFSARDAKGNDIPDAQVFVDGTLVASRLDDGKAHDVDPGKHTVRFVRGGKETSLSVVFAVGEKGRNISVVLGGDGGAPSNATPNDTKKPDTDSGPRSPSRPTFPLVVAGIGGAALIAGAVVGLVGLGQVPDRCSTSPNECTAPPGDKVFDDASSAMGLANVGLGVGIAGLVVGIGGLIWYFSSSPADPASTSARLSPAVVDRLRFGQITF